MKKELGVAGTILGAVLFFQVSTSVSNAQDGQTDLKSLIFKKFDINQDGELTGLEKDGAVSFLQGVDRNGDSNISPAEQTAAIQSLNRMPDPKSSSTPATNAPRTTTPMRQKPIRGVPKQPANNIAIREGVKPDIKIIGRPTAESIEKKRKELEELQKMRDASRRRSMRIQQEAAEKKAEKTAAKKRSYYDKMIIIEMANDGVHTVVPHGAVIFTPPDLAGMVVKEPKGKLMRWPDFLEKYSKYIHTRKVTWETAKGEDPIKEEERKQFAEGNKLVVAVFGSNPITVLEPPPEEEVEKIGGLKSDTAKK